MSERAFPQSSVLGASGKVSMGKTLILINDGTVEMTRCQLVSARSADIQSAAVFAGWPVFLAIAPSLFQMFRRTEYKPIRSPVTS